MGHTYTGIELLMGGAPLVFAIGLLAGHVLEGLFYYSVQFILATDQEHAPKIKIKRPVDNFARKLYEWGLSFPYEGGQDAVVLYAMGLCITLVLSLVSLMIIGVTGVSLFYILYSFIGIAVILRSIFIKLWAHAGKLVNHETRITTLEEKQ